MNRVFRFDKGRWNAALKPIALELFAGHDRPTPFASAYFTIAQAKKLLWELEYVIEQAERAKEHTCKKCGHDMSRSYVRNWCKAFDDKQDKFLFRCAKCKTEYEARVSL